MVVLPPGTLLQLMYLDERLKCFPSGRFIEVGPGSGEVTNRLLQAGWSGIAYDLSTETIARLRERFADEIASGKLTVEARDFLTVHPSSPTDRVDMIISSMVMEHMDDAAERQYMAVAAQHLKRTGRLVGFVPASPRHWGIEDDIAGHCRRYTKQSLATLFQATHWRAEHVAALTYPISNCLLPVSNYLVKRHEGNKLKLSAIDRTKHSGHRNVRFKTHFPGILALLLNRYTMRPLHWLQKLFSGSERALVLYFEAAYEA